MWRGSHLHDPMTFSFVIGVFSIPHRFLGLYSMSESLKLWLQPSHSTRDKYSNKPGEANQTMWQVTDEEKWPITAQNVKESLLGFVFYTKCVETLQWTQTYGTHSSFLCRQSRGQWYTIYSDEAPQGGGWNSSDPHRTPYCFTFWLLHSGRKEYLKDNHRDFSISPLFPTLNPSHRFPPFSLPFTSVYHSLCCKKKRKKSILSPCCWG